MFSKKELVYLALTIFIVSLSIAFDDGSTSFSWAYWLNNFIVVIIIVALSFFAQQIGHKIVARMNGFDTEYSWWGIRSFSLLGLLGRSRTKTFPRSFSLFEKKWTIESFPLGLALCFLVTLLSNGQLFFLAVGQYTLLLKKASRFGRKFVEVTNYEEAKIALAGPMANIILMILGMLFNSYGTFDTFILINAMLALFHMLPLPGLAGTKIYFGSRLLYVSSLVFMVSMTILAYTVSVIPMLLISLASLFISGSLYYYYTYFKG
ncbi:MAG: hypothetical protein QT08_C0014G0036 [archaeon GW2011_AR17]|nr:MAG: hypothetical protein QT08_C0014G0036 [archaeon GW2011_AR17]MBS3154794.1 hypothetical protein [Candidatus Woesearchaeota archaeon]HIH15775.1 hypothetical protein [Nanoarchaeota archaeon]HIH58968.1 hypothetical protein [Nanoarchaeota archaeon]HII14345.1 hypothetical protein [Nanoarchaeota archaeon]